MVFFRGGGQVSGADVLDSPRYTETLLKTAQFSHSVDWLAD